jgi:hypothetical protein
MKFASQLEKIASLIVVLLIIPASSYSQALPAVPNVITRTSFEFQRETYILEVQPDKGARVAKGNLYCANPNQTPELECKNCSLVLKLGQREISRISLGSFGFVYDQGEWHVTGTPPLNILKRGAEPSLISLSQYAGCNGNIYKFYWIDVQKGLTLKPASFVGFGTKKNELYGGDVRLVESSRFYGKELWISGYNNAHVGSFLEQFGESSPGQWILIGYYTQMGGSSAEIENKLGTSK